jgi:gamma-glutamylaminecyclotransferase
MLPAWINNVKRGRYRNMDKDKQKPSDIITSTSTHLVFVGGTLRQGQCNHRYFLGRSKFLGNAKTKKRYALYGSWIPFLSRAGSISQVTGEVYSIDDATLSQLDRLEGHPDAYKREQSQVILQDGAEISAWIYFCDTPQGNLIESGDFLQRTSPRRRKRGV